MKPFVAAPHRYKPWPFYECSCITGICAEKQSQRRQGAKPKPKQRPKRGHLMCTQQPSTQAHNAAHEPQSQQLQTHRSTWGRHKKSKGQCYLKTRWAATKRTLRHAQQPCELTSLMSHFRHTMDVRAQACHIALGRHQGPNQQRNLYTHRQQFRLIATLNVRAMDGLEEGFG